MAFAHLSVLALFCLTVVGTDASQSAEDYWQSVCPNTPMPKALWDLLQPYSKNNLPIKAEQEKQYWTVFLEHDLHPGKKISLGFHKHSDIQPSGLKISDDKTSQPFGARIWKDKTSQPFGARIWKDKTSQPFGARIWKDKTSQPFGARIWKDKTSQPFGARIWKDKTSQPFGARARYEKASETEEYNSIHDLCGKPAAIGEEKYCATSLESMMNFAISKLGKNIKITSSSFAQNKDQYIVEEVKKIGEKIVMCHRLNFENVVFYCHEVNATTSYMVPLVAYDGTKAKALTICHHDTRGMNPDMLYEVLKVKPGTIPICHFVGNKAVAWVPNLTTASESDHPCVI